MRLATLSLFLLVAACDSSSSLGGDTPFVYATDGTDSALDILQIPNGDLVVVGSTEGRIRPADGTLARPSVLRFSLDGELQAAEVYRDVEYGDVQAAAWARDGLVVSLSAGPDGAGDRTVGVFRADESGRRGDALLRFREGFMPSGALVPSPEGGVTTAVYPSVAADPTLYRLDGAGDVVWSTRLAETQDVRQLAPAPGGDVYAVAYGADGDVVVRLDGATGRERWRSVRTSSQVEGLTPTARGLALLEAHVLPDRSTEIRVVELGGDGRERSVWSVDRARGPEEGELNAPVRFSGAAIEALPNGGVALAMARTRGGFETPAEAFVVVLANDGTERSRTRFGVEGRWSYVSRIEPLADGRVAVAGGVGPARVGGFGGDDFDIWVTLYDAP